MNILIHLSSHYDWDPVPDDAVVTEADVQARRVKPTVDGKWRMRVKREVSTHTQVNLPEQQIIVFILGEALRSRMILSRCEGVAQYLSRHVMPHHAPRKSVVRVEVEDSGPEEALMKVALAHHKATGQLDDEDADDLLTAYLEPTESKDHASHIAAHFGVKSEPADAPDVEIPFDGKD